MEAAGAFDIFSRSVEKHNRIYKNYIGDGDTSSYKEVVKNNPYRKYGIIPSKLECVGHIHKRLGIKVQAIRNEYKTQKEILSGRGKLTDKVINSMQNYYGMAIRQNRGHLYPMKKAVGAVLWHCTAHDNDEIRHQFCPNGHEPWCKWKKHQSMESNSQPAPKSSINVPKWIHDILKPLFADLSSDELLLMCLHGKTQNANEALNNIIWSKCPKTIFVKRATLEMAVNSSVINYNDGAKGIENVLAQFNTKPGLYMSSGSQRQEKRKIKEMQLKASEEGN